MAQPRFGGEMIPETSLGDTLQSRHSGLSRLSVVWRITLAVAISWAASQVIFTTEVIVFAPMTALLVVQASTSSTIGLSLQRILGAGVGVALAAVWVTAVGVSWWSFTIAMAVSLLVARALPWSVIGQLQIPVAVLFAMVLGQSSLEQGLIRTLEVALGGAVAIVVSLALPVKPQRTALHTARNALQEHMKLVLFEVAQALAQPQLDSREQRDFLASSRHLRDLGDELLAAYSDLFNLATMNYRATDIRKDLSTDAFVVRRLVVVGMHVRSIASAADYVDLVGLHRVISPVAFESFTQELCDLLDAACASLENSYGGDHQDFENRVTRFRSRVVELVECIQTLNFEAQQSLSLVSFLGRFDHVAQLLHGLVNRDK